jgi:hypothetical protein
MVFVMVAALLLALAAAALGAVQTNAQPACTIIWDGDAGSRLWSAQANWSTNVLPGANDYVCIPEMGALDFVDFASTNVQIKGLTSEENFSLTSGTLGLTDPAGESSISGKFTWTNGTLELGTTLQPVPLTASGGLAWSGGIKAGAGTLLVRDDGTDADDLTLSGTGSWSVNAGMVVNEGHAVATGGSLLLNSGARFENRVGATFEAAGDLDITLSASPLGLFSNAGTFVKSAGASNAASDVSTFFNNTDTVDVQAGTLRLISGGTHDGVFDVAAGTLLNFDGGTHELTRAGDTVRGAGAMRVGIGTVRFRQALDTTIRVTLAGGRLDFDAASSLGGKLTWSSGILDLDGELAVNGGAE